MAQKTKVFTRRKALIILITAAVLLLLLITAHSVFVPRQSYDLTGLAGRQAYLRALGGELDPDT